MTPHLYINTLTIALFWTIAQTSCVSSQNKTIEQAIKNENTQIDSSNTAIIPFDKKYSYPFDSSFNPTKLTQDDFNTIDSLLIVCVTDYNNSLDKEHKGRSIDFKKKDYRQQLIPVLNKKGEKEVWVNCFCHTWDSNGWKTQILVVSDGGNCFFNFKINLITKKYYNLGVNGLG